MEALFTNKTRNHRLNTREHSVGPLSCLLQLRFINKKDRKIVPYMYTINTRTKTIEAADFTNHQQVSTYL